MYNKTLFSSHSFIIVEQSLKKFQFTFNAINLSSNVSLFKIFFFQNFWFKYFVQDFINSSEARIGAG
jgi:hypothetical protein